MDPCAAYPAEDGVIGLLADAVGLAGVAAILLAYFLLQKDVLASHDRRYLWLNLLGSIAVLLSLLTHWNLPSVVIEAAWISISLYGFFRLYRRKSE